VEIVKDRRYRSKGPEGEKKSFPSSVGREL
jgi:hypothetical protein